jgi:hypothetical protein
MKPRISRMTADYFDANGFPSLEMEGPRITRIARIRHVIALLFSRASLDLAKICAACAHSKILQSGDRGFFGEDTMSEMGDEKPRIDADQAGACASFPGWVPVASIWRFAR